MQKCLIRAYIIGDMMSNKRMLNDEAYLRYLENQDYGCAICGKLKKIIIEGLL